MPELQMPKLSDTMTEGTLVAWKKKKGEEVAAGEVLAEIETDKATMEWESPEDGTLTEIYVDEGGKVEVGQRIAFVGEPGESGDKKAEAKKEAAEGAKKQPSEKEKPAPAKAKEKETAPPQEKTVEAGVPSAAKQPTRPPPQRQEVPTQPTRLPPQKEEARIKASPVARRLAGELGVELGTIEGTGPDGRITESDVRAASKSARAIAGPAQLPSQKTPAAIKPAPGSRTQLSGMRKIIAERLVASKAPIPHFYLNIDLDAGPLVAARGELKAAGEESDTAKITVNDFVLKAAVDAAVKVPKVNAAFDEDALILYEDVDLAVAVAIEDGLVTPVIRAAQKKTLREISETMKDLAHRARHKRMKPEEFQGGTFTVSNLGGYGIDYFSAVINPPQGFILSVGAIRKKPMVDDCDQIVVGNRLEIGMSCDHRVIDGALGAEYLKELRRLLENPALLMV